MQGSTEVAHVKDARTDHPDDNAGWMQRRTDAVARGVSNLLPVVIDRAYNAEMWDVEGKRYIDFAAGIAVLNTGHMHPQVKAAVLQQLEHFSHTCFQVTPYRNYIELAERLNRLVPGSSPKKTLLLTTGAEAVENAIKIARAYTGRSGTIAFSGGFHGRTMMGMALTGKVVPYKVGFGPLPGEVYHLPFPIEYHGVGAEASLQALDTLLHSDIDPSRIAAIIIEPVQGEGGFYAAPESFLQALRKTCDQHGIVLIVDEIQTGFARTGRMFAIEHAGVEPDLITVAKSLGGGFPISGVIGRAEIMDAATPGGLGGTYAGAPIACAAALAVLDIIEQQDLCARADAIGALLGQLLRELHTDPRIEPFVGDIRGIGAMVAIELVHDADADRPNPELARELAQACARRGLVILPSGVRGNVVRFLVPLTISDELLREGMAIFADTLLQLADAAP